MLQQFSCPTLWLAYICGPEIFSSVQEPLNRNHAYSHASEKEGLPPVQSDSEQLGALFAGPISWQDAIEKLEARQKELEEVMAEMKEVKEREAQGQQDKLSHQENTQRSECFMKDVGLLSPSVPMAVMQEEAESISQTGTVFCELSFFEAQLAMHLEGFSVMQLFFMKVTKI